MDDRGFGKTGFRLLPLALFLVGLGAVWPLHAQIAIGFGYDGPIGLRGTFRTTDEVWQAIPPKANGAVRAGQPDAAAPLEGFSLNATSARIESRVLVGGAWGEWVGPGVTAGGEKKPLEGIRIRSSYGSVRYRVSSVAAGFSEWAEDGAPALPPDHRLVNAFEVEWLDRAGKGANLEFRALFEGKEFTPWLKEGEKAESGAGSGALIGLEIRNGHGIRYEVLLDARRWQPTVIDGELAGDTTGKHRITALRVFGESFPVRYRVKIQGDGGWTDWTSNRGQCGSSSSNRAILAIQIEPDREGTPNGG